MAILPPLFILSSISRNAAGTLANAHSVHSVKNQVNGWLFVVSRHYDGKLHGRLLSRLLFEGWQINE